MLKKKICREIARIFKKFSRTFEKHIEMPRVFFRYQGAILEKPRTNNEKTLNNQQKNKTNTLFHKLFEGVL